MKSPSMFRGLLSFSGMTMISRVLGLVRDMSINAAFGANAATDAFWVAFRIPNFMRRLFAEGSFSTAFVPVFTEVKEKRSHQELKTLMSRVSGTLGGVLMLITALGVIFAPQVTTLFSPGAIETPEKFELTVNLLRLTFPFLLFVSLTALSGGALNSFHRFGLPALTPVILNLCMITGALWLAPRLHTPIMAMGWAILAAGMLQLLFQLPALRQLDLLTLPRWGWSHPEVRRILKLMVPTLFGSSVAQINLLLDTVIASLLFIGSQSWLSQADRFLELPLGVFGVALGTVILPSLSRHHVATDGEGFSKALDWGLRITLLIAVPAMFALMLLAEPLVATLFQHGRFTAFDTRMATLSISALSFGLPAFALVKVVLPAFYARQDTRTPVRAGVASLIANMVLNVLFLAVLYALWAPAEVKQGALFEGLAKVPGLHMALGVASAAASYINLALLWHWLRKAGVYQRQPGWMRHLGRLALACAVMIGVLLAGLWLWPDWTAVDKWTRVWHLAALVCAGGGAYLATLFAAGFRLRELRGV
ncbi:murein biosynthesis integral membrane protein MurJ [Dyella sp. LX-66]|uniref:murein biosynthesis integral membrane protein MurJ n=1 Tax=unclassified Dyella TaxID=2634549 RepID=UPI001BE0F61A|nr:MULTISPECIES: murein biosynthesis integral membrane protein MurJ [unclassified Dyella]MBT2117822.1 murein biosynthesis integral membrane protein MurJ [Dyella sp. LX-1]MBT2142325.1 murein biosynthesis integral membrane protein MurJ [Dyella sp. LX-66]